MDVLTIDRALYEEETNGEDRSIPTRTIVSRTSRTDPRSPCAFRRVYGGEHGGKCTEHASARLKDDSKGPKEAGGR